MKPMIDALRDTLIVSCQAYPGEPMRHPETMAQIAASVVRGGAKALRAQGLADIRQVKAAVDVPIIGIWKDGESGVFITPTLEHARRVVAAGADILALDGTLRERPDGLSLAQTLERLRSDYPDLVVMADCDSVEAGLAAAEAGADLIGTTLSGYTDTRPKTTGPDLELISELVGRLDGVPVIAEGRIHTPDHVRAASSAGAFATVVGTAITHPQTITSWFAQAVAEPLD